jgi:phosphatidate phosphatase APP1
MRLFAYPGYVRQNAIVVSGRLVYGSLRKPKATDNLAQNILSMLKQYFALGVPRKKITLRYGKQTRVVKTTTRGNFSTSFAYTFTSPGDYTAQYKKINATAKVFLPQKKQLAIITDIDDTLLVSYSSSFFKRIWTALTKNFNTRSSVQEIAALYRQFSGPLFYVSNSQWRLYEALEGFRKINHLPQGPFLLRGRSKYNRIASLVSSYPYEFILLGDDGQQDPELYAALARDFPHKIKAISIRHLGSRKRLLQVEALLPRDKSIVSADSEKCVAFVKQQLNSAT